jgi:hypothetical protein
VATTDPTGEAATQFRPPADAAISHVCDHRRCRAADLGLTAPREHTQLLTLRDVHAHAEREAC